MLHVLRGVVRIEDVEDGEGAKRPLRIGVGDWTDGPGDPSHGLMVSKVANNRRCRDFEDVTDDGARPDQQNVFEQ